MISPWTESQSLAKTKAPQSIKNKLLPNRYKNPLKSLNQFLKLQKNQWYRSNHRIQKISPPWRWCQIFQRPCSHTLHKLIAIYNILRRQRSQMRWESSTTAESISNMTIQSLCMNPVMMKKRRVIAMIPAKKRNWLRWIGSRMKSWSRRRI